MCICQLIYRPGSFALIILMGSQFLLKLNLWLQCIAMLTQTFIIQDSTFLGAIFIQSSKNEALVFTLTKAINGYWPTDSCANFQTLTGY